MMQPTSISEAVALMRANPAMRPVAGCTDLMVAGGRHPAVSDPVDLLRIEQLRGVRVDASGIEIGATTTFDDLGGNPEIARLVPMVADMSRVIGGWQVQARATVGGNIANASPAGDSLPVWLALGASVEVHGPAGARVMPYEQVHLGYGRTALGPADLITRLRVPLPQAGTVCTFRKVGTRQALAISKVVVAAAVVVDGGRISAARVAAGSVAPVPVRLEAVERLLLGERAGPALAAEAGRKATTEVQPVDDVRSTAAYRAHVLGQVVRRLVLDLDGTGSA